MSVDSKRSPWISTEQREALLSDLAQSGLSVVEFARRRGMRPETFYRWRCDANKAQPQGSPAKPGGDVRPLSFVELSAKVSESCLPPPMVVRLGREVEVEVSAANHLDWVAQLNAKLCALQC